MQVFIRSDLWTREQIETLKAMAEEGLQAPQIALAVGRTATAVRSWARDNGVSLKRGRPENGYDATEELKASSQALADATKALLGRMAANDVLAVLGAPCQPRIVCAPFKTSSIVRHINSIAPLSEAA